MKFIVVTNDAWHEYHWVHRSEEDALDAAKEYAANGNEVRVYKLVETYYFPPTEE